MKAALRHLAYPFLGLSAVWKSVIAPVIVPAEKPYEHAQ